MKASKIKEIINRHDWLVDIAAEYTKKRKRFENQSDHITVTSIEFYCLSDKIEAIDFNNHVTIPAKPFLDAIDSLIESIKNEIKDIENSLPMVEFETKLAE